MITYIILYIVIGAILAGLGAYFSAKISYNFYPNPFKLCLVVFLWPVFVIILLIQLLLETVIG